MQRESPPRASRPQLAAPKSTSKPMAKPGNDRRDQDGDDGQQPHVVQQMNARILPDRARYQLRAVGCSSWDALCLVSRRAARPRSRLLR